MRPLLGQPLQQAFSSLATAQLAVTHCPASATGSTAGIAAAAAAAAPVKVTIADIQAKTFYSSSWRITASSNVTAGKLSVQQGKTVAVEVVAALRRSARRTEFAAVRGVVIVEGQSGVAAALRSVQVSVIGGTAVARISRLWVCGAGAKTLCWLVAVIIVCQSRPFALVHAVAGQTFIATD